MINEQASYGFTVALDGAADEAVERLRDAAAAEGLSLFCDLDLGSVTSAGAFRLFAVGDAQLLQKVIQAEPDAALLLPSRIAVRFDQRRGRTVVSFTDPVTVMALTNNPAVTSVAWEERRRMERLRDRLVGHEP